MVRTGGRWKRTVPAQHLASGLPVFADPAFLLVGWARVRGNKGAKTAGVDGRTAASIQARGVEEFLGALRDSLKDRSFSPLPSRERLIPKPGTAKRRRLGISTIRDRVVQASLKLVGEQAMRRIFEIDAARADADLGIGAAWHAMEVTAIDGTTIELFGNDELAAAFGVPSGGTKPKLRIASRTRALDSAGPDGVTVPGFTGRPGIANVLARTRS